MTKQRESPHIQSDQGNLRNFNGTGSWSVVAIQERYRQYCDRYKVENPRPLIPRQHQKEEIVWIYPLMDDVIQGIEEGDPACIALGVDFVEENEHFVFGKALKANTARALRRAQLTEGQKARLREHIVTMLAAGIIPHEMREYSKLLRVIGVGKHWPRLERDLPRDNRFAMRFYKILRAAEGLPV